MPTKSANGLEWKTLPELSLVDEAILSRAPEANPDAACKVQELVEVRQLEISVARIAASEIEEALS